jgi:flagellin
MVGITNFPATMNNASKAYSATESLFSKLSSGKSITSAADNPAGLALSSQIEAQMASMGQAADNTNSGNSFLNTAEGGLG